MQYSKEVEEMICVAKGPNHGPAPIPEEAQSDSGEEIEDISGYTMVWAGAHRSRACKLSLNVRTASSKKRWWSHPGCSGMTHSAAMASEILPGKTIA